MTVFEGAEETLETLRNNLVGFQWTETRRVKIEFRMRQNQRVRERERWAHGYTQHQHPVERPRKGRWEQVTFQLCQVFPISSCISGLEL